MSDRFTDATVAYQGYGRGISLKTISDLNRIVTQGLKPDLTICLDIGVQKGLQRAGFNQSHDRLESEGIEFHRKVKQGYRSLARKEPRRIKVINVSGSPEKISLRIKAYVDELLERKG